MQFESAEMEQMYNDYIGPILAKETAFFQKIKVQQSSTIAGQAPEYEKYQDCVSWRYTSKKMRSFGIDQVHFKQFFWLPKSSFENKCIFTIR